ncbi:MAG: LysR family transcriptional regulator, partial [Myxococcota bacterium]
MTELSYAHLRYFWMVAREGHLTRAARKLRVTQSAVSVQLKKLEESIGAKLFERKGRGLELTSAGRVALDYAENIFTLGDELLEALQDETKAAQRTLRVGVLATLSRNFQIGFLGPLIDAGDVRVRVQSGTVNELVARLGAHELDVVLSNYAPARLEGDLWLTQTIDEQPVSLIGRPPVDATQPIEVLLCAAPLVVPSVESGIRTAFDALTDRLGVKPTFHAEVDDMAMLRLVARQYSGLSVLPPIVVQDELKAGDLVEHARLPGIVESFVAITMPRRMR